MKQRYQSILIGLLLILVGLSSLPAIRPQIVRAATTFLGLTDTPGSYSGYASRAVAVNGSATALTFSTNVFVTDDYIRAKYLMAEYSDDVTALAYRLYHTGAPVSGDKVMYDIGIYSDNENMFLRGYDGSYKYFMSTDWDSGAVEFPTDDVVVSAGNLEAESITVDAEVLPATNFEITDTLRLVIDAGETVSGTGELQIWAKHHPYVTYETGDMGVLGTAGNYSFSAYAGEGATNWAKDNYLEGCQYNLASGDYTTIGGGCGTTLTDYAMVLGGFRSTSAARYSITTGHDTVASTDSEFRVNSGRLMDGLFFLQGYQEAQTLTDEWEEVSLSGDGSGLNARLYIDNDWRHFVLIDTEVTMMDAANNHVASYQVEGVFSCIKVGEITVPVYWAISTTTLYEDDASWDVSFDNRIGTECSECCVVYLKVQDTDDEEDVVSLVATTQGIRVTAQNQIGNP